jgi:hypothetical protein
MIWVLVALIIVGTWADIVTVRALRRNISSLEARVRMLERHP